MNSAYTVVFLLALFYLFRRLHISPGFFYINFLWLLHWLGPFRGNAADPLNTDAGVLMFQTLMLLAIYRQRHDLLMLLLPLAVLHKEVFIAWAVVYGAVLLSERIFDCEKSDGLVYVMLAIAFSVLIKWITNHMIPPLQPGRGSLITLLFNVRESLHHPVRVLRWGAAMFTAYGLFFIPLGLQLVRPWQLNRFQISLLLFFAVNLLFGLLAGDDHTRLLYLGLPFLFTLLGSTSSGTASKWFPAAMLSLPVTGLWSGVPVVPPAITGLPQWAPEYGPWGVSAFWLIAGAIGSAALIVFFYKKKPLSAFRTPGL